MKSKSVERILQRGSCATMWGRRKLLYLRIPQEVLPEARPPQIMLGESAGFEGHWSRVLENGQVRHSSIEEVWSGRDPRLREHDHMLWHVEEESPNNWSWWEARWYDVAGIDPENHWNVVAKGEIDENIVEAYIKYREWVAKYTQGLKGSTGNEILDRALCAGNWAKRTQHQIDPKNGDLILVYVIRYFGHEFSSEIANLISFAAKQGVKVKVLKGPPPKSFGSVEPYTPRHEVLTQAGLPDLSESVLLKEHLKTEAIVTKLVACPKTWVNPTAKC